jgi:hypothetical protein
MDTRFTRRCILAAAFVVSLLSIDSASFADDTIRQTTPGPAFSVLQKRGTTTADVREGRKFQAKAFDKVILRGVLQMPLTTVTDFKLKRLVVHFRTSPLGPSLRSVELRNGTNSEFRLQTNIKGDYVTREATKPEDAANTWTFDIPVKVSAQTVVLLEVQFPGGFDSKVDTGWFTLTGVGADFSRKH